MFSLLLAVFVAVQFCLNRYISLLNAEPNHHRGTLGRVCLNRYISLLNAELGLVSQMRNGMS